MKNKIDRLQKGFTLIELMAVIAIVGILTTVAVPMYNDYMIRSKIATVVATCGSVFKSEVTTFYEEHEYFIGNLLSGGSGIDPEESAIAAAKIMNTCNENKYVGGDKWDGDTYEEGFYGVKGSFYGLISNNDTEEEFARLMIVPGVQETRPSGLPTEMISSAIRDNEYAINMLMKATEINGKVIGFEFVCGASNIVPLLSSNYSAMADSAMPDKYMPSVCR